MDKAFEAFNLSDKETRVYLAALQLGECSVAQISNKSDIPRTTVYDVVIALRRKGLLARTIRKKKYYYCATDPRKLEDRLQQHKIAFQSALPRLLSIASLNNQKSRFRIFEGKGGIKQATEDLLANPDMPVHAWILGDIFSMVGDNYFSYFVNQRFKKRIWGYVIVPESQKWENYRAASAKSLRKTRVDRLLNLKEEIPVAIYLYGRNRISLISFREEIALIIDSQEIFAGIKGIFEAHWARLSDGPAANASN